MTELNYTINTTSMQGFLDSLNVMSGGFFINVIPITIFLVVFISFLKFEYQPRDSLLYATIVGLLISIMFRAMNLLNDTILIMFVALMVINIIMMVKDQ